MRTVTATMYAQIEPVWNYWNDQTKPPVGAKVRRLTQKKPDEPLGGCITVKLNIELPAQAFMPLEPEATIVVPAEFITQPITVTAEDPSA